MKPIKKKLFVLYLDNRLYQVLSTQMVFDVRWDISGKLVNDIQDQMLRVSEIIEDTLVKERKIRKV